MGHSVARVKGQPEVIFFDAAGTLVHLVEPVGVTYSAIARKHGADLAPERFNEAFKRFWKAMPARERSPGPRPGDDRPWWREVALGALRDVLPAGVPFDEEAWFDELYPHFAAPGVWAAHEETREVLASLSAGHRLAVISNFDGRLRKVLADLDLERFFEVLFISSEIGADKPDPWVFQTAMGRMEVKPENCLHVGDDPDRDVAGAQAAGIACFHLQRPHQTLRDIPLFHERSA